MKFTDRDTHRLMPFLLSAELLLSAYYADACLDSLIDCYFEYLEHTVYSKYQLASSYYTVQQLCKSSVSIKHTYHSSISEMELIP